MDFWESFRPATCMPENCFCEAIHYGDLIRQPMNTWSNLFFIFVGIYIYYRVRKNKEQKFNNQLLRSPSLSYLYSVSCILVGIGSFFYHASLSFIGQWVDVMGMYLAVTFFILYNFQRLWQFSSQRLICSYLLVNSLLGYVLYAYPLSRRYLFGIFVVSLIVIAFYTQFKIKSQISNKKLWLAIGSFALGFGIWILDLTKILCFENSLFQGHSLWHLMTALASFYIYDYYASEQGESKQEYREQE